MAASIFAADFDHHRAFLDHAAELAGAEDGFVTTSGWSANVGLIEAISGPKRPIYIDRYAHASIWGGRSSRAASPGFSLTIARTSPDPSLTNTALGCLSSTTTGVGDRGEALRRDRHSDHAAWELVAPDPSSTSSRGVAGDAPVHA